MPLKGAKKADARPAKKGGKRAAEPVFGFAALPHNMGAVQTLPPVSTPTPQPGLIASLSGTFNDGVDSVEGSDATVMVPPYRPNAITRALKRANNVRHSVRLRSKEASSATITRSQGRLMLKVTKLPFGIIAPSQKIEDAITTFPQVDSLQAPPLIDQAEEYAHSQVEGSDAIEPPKKKQRTAKESKDTTSAVNKPKRVPLKDQTLYQQEVKVPFGVSPYPEFNTPSAAACQAVNSLLTMMHGDASPPAKIPPPSLEIAGCGEVPMVLDALIRTLLSGATFMGNADMAIQGLKDTFGVITKTIKRAGQDVVVVENLIDWNKVRLAEVEEVEAAIKSGGLAIMKSRHIKDILDWVYWENVERTEAFKKEKESGIPAVSLGLEKLTQSQKDMEIWMLDHDILTLDHLGALSPEDTMNEFLKYRGVGVKTAACVLLFNMKVPCFAVDTHVFRICKWLGWIPEKANRDKAFAHLDAHVPDPLKYSLHQLFIRHGKTCKRCQAITNKATKGWDDCVCPLELLLTRTGKDKVVKTDKDGKKKVAHKSKEADDDGDDDDGNDIGEDVDDEGDDANIDNTAEIRTNGPEEMGDLERLDSADAAEAVLNPEL